MSNEYKGQTESRILIIDEAHPLLISGMKEQGYTFEYALQIGRSDILQVIYKYTGLIVRSKTTIDRELLEKAVNLKFVGRAGSGMDNIDEAFAREKGIICFNTPEANRDAVGEHTVGMMLGLLRNIARGDAEV